MAIVERGLEVMNSRGVLLRGGVLAGVFLTILFAGQAILPSLVPQVLAHCDTMGGPVIKDAERALETGDVAVVLKWVAAKDEEEIRQVFARTLAVRVLSEQARELADMYFFETVVRVHRAGEGAAYTGIKPTGSEVEPGIEAADHAVAVGSAEEIAREMSGEVATEIDKRFREVMKKKAHMSESIEAGREYVRAYITFIHYVEGVHLAVAGQAGESEGSAAARSHGH
jgi:hypothetical protein